MCKKFFRIDDSVSLEFWCNESHKTGWINQHADKQRQARKKSAESFKKKGKKATSKALKEFNREDVPWQHKLTKTAFNKMRVLEEKLWFKERGLEPECISCGKKNMDFCCGHFKTVGSQGRLRYDRTNTYLQCNRYCNKGLSGNISGNKNTRGYTQGLIDRFGAEKAREVIEYCETATTPRKWEWQELEEMRKEFNAEARRLTKQLETGE